MKTSESLTKIAPALLKAQSLMGAAVKGAKNPFFKSTYADLGAVLEACKELLNSNGVVILQPHSRDEFGTFVETILMHESGEFISSQTPVIFAKEGDPQAQGSAITYARRYGLQSLLSMPAEDDDGEKAMVRKSPAKAPEKGNTLTLPAGQTSGEIKVDNTTPIEGNTVETATRPRTTFRKPSVKVETVTVNGAASTSDDLGLN